MPSSYLILPEKRLIVGRFTGPTRADDIKDLLEVIWADPLFNRAFHLLMDFSKAALKFGLAEAKLICESIACIAGGVMGSTAIIASGPVGTALSMLLTNALSLITPSAVFSTWAAAVEFLGVDVSEDSTA